jgi:8-oxo-dGTP diphosphatase
MTLRRARHMTSIFLVRDDQVLLLYRIGSTAINDSWVGIGGHLEPDEIGDPTAAALRELHEEVGLTEEQICDLSLRYVSLRDSGQELRFTYYFTAELRAGTTAPTECTEGELRWFPIAPSSTTLDMPPTASVALQHWICEGRRDDLLRTIAMTVDGPMVLPLVPGSAAGN